MMTFVENQARRSILLLAPARCIDHHQRMVGYDDIGLLARPGGLLYKAFAVMRAAGIDAFAAPVGQRGGTVAAEQGGQPAGQVAADHVAVLAVGSPARNQMGEDRRPSGKAALQRILQIEQAEIIFPALAHDHFLAKHFLVRVDAPGFSVELALQRLGKGGYPNRTASLAGPQRGRSQIAERLANPRARFGEQHIRGALDPARVENSGDRCGVAFLTLAVFRSLAGQRFQSRQRRLLVHGNRARRRSRRLFFPFRQFREQPALGLDRLFEPFAYFSGPWPAQPVERLRAAPRPLPLFPIRCFQSIQ